MNHLQRTSAPPSETAPPSGEARWVNSRRVIIWCAAVGIIGAVFLTGHSNHVIALLPYLLLVACSFMHLFMHRGHRHDGKDGRVAADVIEEEVNHETQH